jgi:aldehyde dehydrogenase
MKFSCSLFVLSSLCAFSSFAATDPLVGKWKTIDDKTGYSLSDVMIEKDKNNSYKAVIVSTREIPGAVKIEIFGPVLAVTTFKDEAEALAIANDTPYGLGAGVWSRNGNVAYRMGRAIQAGRVWTNCYHAYPAHAAFGGYKESGIGRETHKVMLDHYQQTKNLLVSYSENKLGFF